MPVVVPKTRRCKKIFFGLGIISSHVAISLVGFRYITLGSLWCLERIFLRPYFGVFELVLQKRPFYAIIRLRSMFVESKRALSHHL
jgi:hypothetical protein